MDNENVNHKEKVLEYITSYQCQDKIIRNRMGCDESWYDPYYAIKESFSVDEINNMTEDEVSHLVKLAWNVGEALY